MKNRNNLTLALALAVCPLISPAWASQVEYEQQPPPPLPNSISGTETVDSRMTAWIRKEQLKLGQNTLPDGREASIVTGKGTIVVGPGDKNFVQARINAYYKALLDAKFKCAEFQQVSIETELSQDFSQPGDQRAAADLKRLEREGLAKEGVVQVARALNADMKSGGVASAIQTAGMYVEKVLDNKVRESLTKMGIDPNKPVSEQQLKPILNTSSFKNMAKAVAAERCTGLKVLASFEQNPSSGQGSVGIVTIYTRLLHEVADAIVSGNYQLIPKGNPGLPIEQHIPADLRAKLASFGTQLVRNERGDYVLLSFGQAQPVSASQQSKDMAYRQARLQAQAQIRLFLGSQVHSHNQMALGEQSIERAGEDIQAALDFTASSSVRAVAESLPIRGIQEADSWETLHPANNGPVVGVIMEWKASSAQLASVVRKLNAASAAVAAETSRRGLPDTPSVQTQTPSRSSNSSAGGGDSPIGSGPAPTPARTTNASSGQGGVNKPDF
jgi:hypothetical protein